MIKYLLDARIIPVRKTIIREYNTKEEGLKYIEKLLNKYKLEFKITNYNEKEHVHEYVCTDGSRFFLRKQVE